LVLWK